MPTTSSKEVNKNIKQELSIYLDEFCSGLTEDCVPEQSTSSRSVIMKKARKKPTKRSKAKSVLEKKPNTNSRERLRRSYLWYHFNVMEKDKGQCRYCHRILSIKGGTTANLKRHLKNVHPAVVILPQESPEKKPVIFQSAVRERSRAPSTSSFFSSDEQFDEITSSIDSYTCRTNGEVIGADSAYSNCQETSQWQPKLVEISPASVPIYNNKVDFSPVQISVYQSKQIDDQLLKMLVKGCHRFNLVEDVEFKSFINLLSPGYSFPSKKTLVENTMPLLYHETVNKIKEKLQIVTAVCLSTENWTSINHDIFLDVTAHCIDEDTQLRSIFLGCYNIDPYNAHHIANCLNNVTKEWDICNKVIAIVTDNSVEMIEAARQINIKNISCFGHTLNSILRSSLKHISTVIDKIRHLIRHFKTNPDAIEKLKELQSQMKMPTVQLQQDVNTRWNSTYSMLSTIFQNKEPLILTCSLLQMNEKIVINERDWEIIGQAVEMLNIFDEIITEMCSENVFSLSKILYLTKTFILTTQEFLKKNNIHNEIEIMGNNIIEKLGKRMSKEETELVAQITLLDPRFKRIGVGDEVLFTDAYVALSSKLETVSGKTEKTETAGTTKVKEENSSRVWRWLDAKLARATTDSDCEELTTPELETYLGEPFLSRSGHPLLWWQHRRHFYPRLYTIALELLCIPANSIPSQRIFSKAATIFNQKRQSLSQKHLSMILFLKNNLD